MSSMYTSHMLNMRPLSTVMLFWKKFIEDRRPIRTRGLFVNTPKDDKYPVYRKVLSKCIWKNPEVKSVVKYLYVQSSTSYWVFALI